MKLDKGAQKKKHGIFIPGLADERVMPSNRNSNNQQQRQRRRSLQEYVQYKIYYSHIPSIIINDNDLNMGNKIVILLIPTWYLRNNYFWVIYLLSYPQYLLINYVISSSFVFLFFL